MCVRYLIWITNKTCPHCFSSLFTDQCVCTTNGRWQFFSQLFRRIRKYWDRNSFLIVCRNIHQKFCLEMLSTHSHDSLRLLWAKFMIRLHSQGVRRHSTDVPSSCFSHFVFKKKTSSITLESCSAKLRNNKVAFSLNGNDEGRRGKSFSLERKANEQEKRKFEENPSKH